MAEFRKEFPISNFKEITPVGAPLVHADRRTDTTKLINAFRDYAKALKKTNQN